MLLDIERHPNHLAVRLDSGILRLEPMSPSIVRVVQTLREDFRTAPSRIVLPDCKEPVEWSVRETDRSVTLSTAKLDVRLDRRTGALSWRDAHGDLLVSEPRCGGRTLEAIEVVHREFDDSAEMETVSGVDGIRVSVQGAAQETVRAAYHAKLAFEWVDGEALYGLGSHEEGMMDLRGNHQYLYQENLKAVVPVLLSTKGYGILVDCLSLMTFHDDAFGSYLWCDVVDELDYYFLYGPEFDGIVHGYRMLTGGAPMLPRWMFGYLQSKERYRSQEELLEVVREYRRRRIPIDAVVLDWKSWIGDHWGQKSLDPERFPDPEGMMDELHAMHARLMVSVWPNMMPGGEDHGEFLQNGLLLGDRVHYDPFDPAGRALYWNQAEQGLFRHGIDAWWCDCTEPFEADWRGAEKPEPEERMRINVEESKKYLDPAEINAYSLLHSQGIYEGQRGATDRKRVVNLTRSSHAGQHRYSTVTWSGDVSANWETLRRQIPAGLNFCVTGEPYWTLDIGGFFAGGRSQWSRWCQDPDVAAPWFLAGEYDRGCEDPAYRELYVRWFQFGAFLPVFRSHGTDAPREVWRFGEPGSPFHDTLVRFIQLRYRLLPYLYSLAGQVTHGSGTMLRALAFDFRLDEKVHGISDEFMLGPAFLVCPVTRPMYFDIGGAVLEEIPKSRSVYLPKGAAWYDFWTGGIHEGGRTVVAPAPLEILPLFVRAGSVVPMASDPQWADEVQGADLVLRIYPGADGSFLLYDDEGDGYGYEKGDYSMTLLSWNDLRSEIAISPAGGRSTVPRRFDVRVLSTEGERAGSVEYRGERILFRV